MAWKSLHLMQVQSAVARGRWVLECVSSTLLPQSGWIRDGHKRLTLRCGGDQADPSAGFPPWSAGWIGFSRPQGSGRSGPVRCRWAGGGSTCRPTAASDSSAPQSGPSTHCSPTLVSQTPGIVVWSDPVNHVGTSFEYSIMFSVIEFVCK